LCSTRRLTSEGFAGKARELDDQRSGEIPRWRERWAHLQNETLRDHGHESRVDHRTLEEQGLDREPGHHQGPALTAVERRRERTDVVERWREEGRAEAQSRLERAAQLGRIEREAARLHQSILDLSGDIAAAKRDRVRLETLEAWKQHRANDEAARRAERARSVEHDTGKSRGGRDIDLT
jgi:hypothetical protein